VIRVLCRRLLPSQLLRGKFKISRWIVLANRIKQLIMKYSRALMLIFSVLGAIPGRADDVLPARFNFDRYSAMIKKSPFAIATAVAVSSATPDFAKDLYVANAARSPEGDMVTIASSSDQNFKKYLSTKEPVDGYGIASIEWSEKVGATKVTISKDGKFATITFNQALLSQQTPPTGPQATAAIPSPFVQRSVPQQVPSAHTRGVIQRNPQAVAAAASTPTPTPLPMSNPGVQQPWGVNPAGRVRTRASSRQPNP
jgi:hypothetical protein